MQNIGTMKEGTIMWQMVKGYKRMLSNTIDGSDGIDHFDGIKPIQVIETCRQINTIIRLALKEGCEARFIANRLPKTRFRFHGSSVAEKVQDLQPNEAGGAWQKY